MTQTIIGAVTTIIVALIGAGILSRKGFFASIKNIEKATNHVQEGEPTLIERVTELREESIKKQDALLRYQMWVAGSLSSIAKQVGVILPPPPKDHSE